MMNWNVAYAIFIRLWHLSESNRSAASVYMAHSWPLETILLFICLEHEKMIAEILSRLKKENA